MTPEDTQPHVTDIDELVVRPGTYFNPQTEVVVVVVDDVSIDQEIFNLEPYEGADWVRISDEVPVEMDALDTAMQRFQTDHVEHDSLPASGLEPVDDDLPEDEPELEPDPDPEDL